jgi:outer membrane receptor protein involved in Fe transport
MRTLCTLPAVTAALAFFAPARANEHIPPADDIIVHGRALEQVGIASSGSEGVVGYADFEDRPISRVGELAENVPGLIATQHSGSGKANQYFLRGFNLDHGTDLAGFVDGAPINMRSHGHGQGYLDLNFLIPEIVERIDYTKGPYHAEKGDFASAGSISFTTKSKLVRPLVEVEAGSFGHVRALMAGSGEAGSGTVLGAFEGTISDGPYVLGEKLRKVNGLIKYSQDNWSLSLSGYHTSYRATDQVPLRAIQSGLISRLGFIDGDLGGRVSRVAANFNGDFDGTKVSAYAIGYRFRLTSNFTYFLDDPVNGDEFQQRDGRGIFGGAISREFPVTLLGAETKLRIGVDTRFDRVGKVGLYRSAAGIPTATIRQDRIDEYGGGLYGEAEMALTPALRLVLGLRSDTIGYRVQSGLAANSGKGSDSILTPKAALAWRATKGVEFYANYGEGYHSNDVRGTTISVDPASGAPADRVPVFARSRGEELGVRVERSGLIASLVGFRLDLASELVFVGDAGNTEPNAATRRYGAEFSLFWKPLDRITLDAEAAYTRARFRGVESGLDRIPGAVPLVLSGGVSARLADALTATVRVRHFGKAPLIEDNSQRSDPTTIVNFGAYLDVGQVRLSGDVLNLFNSRDADITYFYASRLPGEPAEGVEDRHLHPIEPRQVRISARLRF